MVEPPGAQPCRGASPREPVVERACPEHHRERGRVDPDREALEQAVGEDDEDDSRRNGREERVLVEYAAKPRLDDGIHP